jgi:hypothetical protein
MLKRTIGCICTAPDNPGIGIGARFVVLSGALVEDNGLFFPIKD